MSNKLTIVLIIDSLDNLDKSMNSINNQTKKNFDLVLVDRYRLTKYNLNYQLTENHAIANCKTPYIYFMSNLDTIDKKFIATINEKIFWHNKDIYWFLKDDRYDVFKFSKSIKKMNITKENFWYIHSTEDKIFKTDYLKSKYLSFDLSKYFHNISHVMLNYLAAYDTNKRYFIHKRLLHRLYKKESLKEYITEYRQMFEDLKIKLFLNKPVHIHDIKKCLFFEEQNIIEKIKNENNR